MRILFDIRPLQTFHRFRGIGIYLYNLLKNILELDNTNIYHLWGYKYLPLPKFVFEYSNVDFSFIVGGTEFQRFRQQFTETIKLNLQLLKIKPDVIHFNMQLNPFTFHRSITTCHDTIPFIFRSQYLDNFFKWLKWNLHRLSVKQSDLVLTVSETSKRDIFRYYHIDKDKIMVIYNGLPEIFREYDEEITREVLKKYGLEDFEYILYVGASDSRKNVSDLAEVYYNGILSEFPEVRLVWVGNKRYYYDTIDIWEGRSPQPFLTGFVPDEDLPAIYAGASVFAFPSLYEGFGLPVIESLSVGTPVVAYDNSAISEYSAPGLIKCRNKDMEGFKRELIDILKGNDFKSKTFKDSKKWASAFSWEECARKTIEVYERVCGEKRDRC